MIAHAGHWLTEALFVVPLVLLGVALWATRR